MAYELYKTIKPFDNYFKDWKQSNIDTLTDELKVQIYDRYVVKCTVFQRDSFKCQNIECKTLDSPLTLHHIKFKKNKGLDKVRNGVTLCRTCHMGYHKAKRAIVFGSGNHLPTHIKGHIIKLEKPVKVDWKQIKSDMGLLRKQLKENHGILISLQQLQLLMKFLTVPYNEWDD